MELWLVALGGIFTLLGVSLGFFLSELAEARRRREDANVAWDRLEDELRVAVVVLDLTLEKRSARFAVDPPLGLPTLHAQYPALVRTADKRVIQGIADALQFFEIGSLPALRDLWDYQRASTDEKEVPSQIIDVGIHQATESRTAFADMHRALLQDNELRRRLHRVWPYSRTARNMREALDQILEKHLLKDRSLNDSD